MNFMKNSNIKYKQVLIIATKKWAFQLKKEKRKSYKLLTWYDHDLRTEVILKFK